MTNLTPAQLALVAHELETMLREGETDEFWRVATMLDSGQFNVRLGDFPEPIQRAMAGMGPRRRDYDALCEQVRGLSGLPFDVHELGSIRQGDRMLPLLKIASRGVESPYAARFPICLVAGIHGDEPDGILASIEFARRFARIPEFVSTYALTIYPCLNPVGYERMTRENGNGRDLNREFQRESAEEEVRIMERELRAKEFTGLISGHSDYESFGIYAYATGAVLSERLAKPALFQASNIIPINLDPVIDGHPAQYGIINRKFPGSLGPLTRGQSEPFDIVIETPNLFALRKRIEVQVIVFETILQEYRAVAAEGMYL